MKIKKLIILLLAVWAFVFAQDSSVFSKALLSGELKPAANILAKKNSDESRYQLGVIQFLQSIEHLSQSWYKYGNVSVDSLGMLLPILRLPVAPNPSPEEIDYPKFRQVFKDFYNDLALAESTLAKVNDENVKLKIPFDKIRLDLNGDGIAGEEEVLLNIFKQYNRAFDDSDLKGGFNVSFDFADVYWLRGYTHLLMSMLDSYLAYDGRELFDRTAQLSFTKPNTPYSELLSSVPSEEFPVDMAEIVDLVSFFHLINLPLEDATRMRSALAHLKEVIRLSRLNWQAILTETDDDHEWIPSPSQKSVVPVEVTTEMVEGWQTFLDEADDILDGKKLIPYWRVGGDKGVNLNKVFNEPSKFDLVLWIQGTDALKYIETGELSSGETWQGLQELFRGNFIGFAIWFN